MSLFEVKQCKGAHYAFIRWPGEKRDFNKSIGEVGEIARNVVSSAT